MNNIRNFCIIAHIDHGKSTLADRLLELTGTVEKRKMKERLLDRMELERERGITIKLKPVRMKYRAESRKSINSESQGTSSTSQSLSLGNIPPERNVVESKGLEHEYILNLIDTPGHVDFSYEVSRSLAAVEGAILLVDASQGIQAQTIANLHLAQTQGLTIIPAINKIDLPNVDVEGVRDSMMALLKCKQEDVCLVSGKTGQGVRELLEAIVQKVPQPQYPLLHLPLRKGETIQKMSSPYEGEEKGGVIFRALIFDSVFDEYRGVVAYVRVFNGSLKKGDHIHFIGTDTDAEVLNVGYLAPDYIQGTELKEGEIGYVITNLKEVVKCSVGDTILSFRNEMKEFPIFKSQVPNKFQIQNSNNQTETIQSLALPGYEEMKPMVFAGLFSESGEEYGKLRSSLEKLRLTDAALQFEPEHSKALGFGFRCGFLGLLHLDIIRERLEREYDLDLVITVPSVGYRVFTKTPPKDGEYVLVKSPQELPDPTLIDHVEEPMARMEILVPTHLVGKAMGVFTMYEGTYEGTTYITEHMANLEYLMPLSEILIDFYDNLKSATSGYASMSYELFGFEKTEIQKMDILVAEEPVEALAMIVYKHRAQDVGRRIVEKLKEHLPRQMFEIKLQAAIGGKIVAAERLSGMKKNVLAKMSGGDYTRKLKLIQKQKKGKKKMMAMGRVRIPQEVYLEILKR